MSSIGRFIKLHVHRFPQLCPASLSVLIVLSLAVTALAAVGGSISGTVRDATTGVIPGATVTVTNRALRTEFKTMTDSRGHFSFPNLAVGTYELSMEVTGFKPLKRSGLV